ncbi:MAG: DUF488 domain-containing protein [candidate division Zixibacteria bacterium]|nr:DUF488 domain-containing protein [candidate division Zixibacteria bacterium]
MEILKHNQRIIISLLLNNFNKMPRTRLAKLLFLLRQQNPGANVLYDFFPYKFGPYSTLAFRDITKLSEKGWLYDTKPIELVQSRESEALAEVKNLPQEIKLQLVQMNRRLGKLTDKKVTQLVYKNYPEFCFLSEKAIAPHMRPHVKISVYTVGYEGENLDSFLNKLIQFGIKRLIDVRYNPNSRVWGFSKKTLGGWCQKVGIEYIHRRELGVPGKIRSNATSKAAIRRLLWDYERNYLPTIPETLSELDRMVVESPSVLLCMERCSSMCHRGILAKYLHTKTGLPVIHL